MTRVRAAVVGVHLDAYRRCKALAEKAAWDYIGTQTATSLTTILPGAIFGPLLSSQTLGSAGIIQRMMMMTGVPRIGLRVVDVRDVAAAHLLALGKPASAGHHPSSSMPSLPLLFSSRPLASIAHVRQISNIEGDRSQPTAPSRGVRCVARFPPYAGPAAWPRA